MTNTQHALALALDRVSQAEPDTPEHRTALRSLLMLLQLLAVRGQMND